MFLPKQTVLSTDKAGIRKISKFGVNFLQAFFKEFNDNKIKWKKLISLISTSSRLYLEKRKTELEKIAILNTSLVNNSCMFHIF